MNTLLVRPELSEPVNTTIGSDTQPSLPLDAMDIFYAGITTRVSSWWNVLRLLRQVKPIASYIIGTEPEKLVETKTWWDTSEILWLEGFTTVNTGQKEFYKQIIQYWQRREILDRFDVLAQREDNWDGYDSKKPTELSLARAKHLMEELLDSIVSNGHLWLTPFISSDEDGDITVEWYEKGRQLHIQIGKNDMEYLQVWGTNIDTEMYEDFLTPGDYLTLWEWLLHG